MMELITSAAFLMIALFPTTFCSSSWNDPSKDQYHIQTDEGPERYFRYQTLNGQYRKEKRLEDGTVIGTYGWLDADGYYRMRDYIADGAGYRIVKSKNVYVGAARPINEALNIAKKAPSEGGTSIGNSPVQNTYTYSIPSKPTHVVPNVEVSFNSVPSSTIEPPISSTPLYLPPSSTPAPPVVSTTHSSYLPPSSTPVPAYLPPSSTPVPVYISSTYLPVSSTVAPELYYKATEKPDYYSYLNSATRSPPIQSNSVYSSDPQYEHYSNPYIYQNGPTYPINKFGQTYNGFGNGYNRQFPLYDGVSVTNDGFRYYIPKQYHEEQNHSDNQKSGSFGYVDPFGIRRVVYYNAGPDGFKHRKNNRYVGFDATPYDPRPY